MKIVYNFTKFIKFTYFPVWDEFFSYSSLLISFMGVKNSKSEDFKKHSLDIRFGISQGIPQDIPWCIFRNINQGTPHFPILRSGLTRLPIQK